MGRDRARPPPLTAADAPPPEARGERLQKLLARRGYGSRRKAEALIREGRVRVDGRPASIGQRVLPSARVTVDGAPPPPEAASLTLMLHKPPGVLVAASDDRGRRTVFDLLRGLPGGAPPALRHVGRLDRDSEGLLLLTTDGELAHRVAHPRHGVAKTYEALVAGRPADGALARLREGVALDDGPARAAEAERLRRGADGGWWVRLVLREGRKRQARRMLAAAGHPVRRLIRTRLGPLALGGLAAGAARPLGDGELAALRAACGLAAAPLLPSASGEPRAGAPAMPSAPDEAAPRESLPAAAAPEGAAPGGAIARSVAIDGPAASGKSAVGRALARRLGYGFLDTGLMYRACTLAVIEAGADPADERAVAGLVRALDLGVRWPDPATPRVAVAGEDVSGRLREPAIEAAVSLVSRIPEVRDELVRRQRAFAARSPIVMAGRDIGTRVLTEARTKLYLHASLAVRAARRLAEERAAGRASGLDAVSAETERRDRLDATGKRAVRPEQAAPGAVVIDTDGLGVEEVVAAALEAHARANAA